MKWAEGTPLTAWLWWIIVHSNLSEGVCPCYLLLSGTQCSYMCTQTINVCKSFMVLIRAFLCIAYRRREKNEANLCLRQRRNNRQLSRQLAACGRTDAAPPLQEQSASCYTFRWQKYFSQGSFNTKRHSETNAEQLKGFWGTFMSTV